MAIVFTELVKKGTNSGSTSGGDKYLNMIKMMTCQYGYDYSTSTPILLSGSLDLTQEYFDTDKNSALLIFPGNQYLNSIETPENIRHINMNFENCENLKTLSLLGYGYVDNSGSGHTDEVFDGHSVSYCTSLTTINLPEFQGTLAYSFVSDANGYCNIEKLVIPQVYKIASGAFNDARNLKLIDFRGRKSSEIPGLDSGCFYMGSGTNCTVVIPDALYDTWTTYGTWYSLYSSAYYHFVKESEYVEQ